MAIRVVFGLKRPDAPSGRALFRQRRDPKVPSRAGGVLPTSIGILRGVRRRAVQAARAVAFLLRSLHRGRGALVTHNFGPFTPSVKG